MSFLGNLGSSFWDVAKVPLSVIPGVGNYLGSMESAAATKDANEKNLQAVRETNAANAALWREQTAYNTPENQVQRLRNAGLNPMLAYGTVAEGRAASAPTMQAPEVRPVPARDYSGFKLAEFQQVLNMQEQNALIRAQRAKTIADTLNVAKNTELTDYELKVYRNRGGTRSDSVVTKTWKDLLEFGGQRSSFAINQVNKAVNSGVHSGGRILDYIRSIPQRLEDYHKRTHTYPRR